MKPIEFLDYDKISDDVLYLGSKYYLRMNVSLSRKKEPDIRYHFHREFEYDSAYAPKKKFISIRRSFDYYLSIDSAAANYSDGILIWPQDMILFRTKLSQVQKWFDDGTYGIRGKDLVIAKKREPIILDGLAFQRYIQFEPIVLIFDSDQAPGVRLTLANPSNFVDINVDKFYALLYLINEINLYQSAQELINYIGRPGFGTNLYEISNGTYLETQQSKMTGGVENRKIKSKANKSFFDTPVD